MKNSECEIHIVNKKGDSVQIYLKRKNIWMQIACDVVREVTAEQMLSHILPILEEGYKGPYKIVVRRE